jgi:hypothetical protein
MIRAIEPRQEGVMAGAATPRPIEGTFAVEALGIDLMPPLERIRDFSASRRCAIRAAGSKAAEGMPLSPAPSTDTVV